MRVRVSADGVTFRDLGVRTLRMAPDPVSAYRDFSQWLPMDVTNVRYVRFEILSKQVGPAGDHYVGLSKVRFYSAADDKAPVSSGLVLHLDASDTNGDGNIAGEPVTGATIGSWVDKSGTNHHGTVGGNPRLIRNVLNGRPVIRFDGSDEYTLPAFTGVTAGEIFIVVKPTKYPPEVPALTGFWDFGTAGAQTHYSWVDNTVYDAWGTDTRNDGINPTMPLDQWNVYSVSSVPGSWNSWLNGVLQRSRAGNTVAFPPTPAIGRSFPGVTLVGDIAEVVMYNRGLSALERSQVQDYLQRKYNLGTNYNGPKSAPLDTEGITVHLDASTVSAVGDGAALGRWQDRSGRNFDATISASDPLWVRSGMGGRPTVRFNGNDEFTLGNLASAFATGATLFLVTSPSGDAAYNYFTTRNNDPWWRYDGNGLSYMGDFRNPRNEGFTAMPTTGQYVYTVESTSAFWQLYESGIGKGAVGAAYNAGDDYRIGGGYGVAQKYLSGDISEVILYDRGLSSDKIAEVGAYLREKYDVNTRHSTVPVTTGRVLHLAADAIPNAANGAVMGNWLDLSSSGLTATVLGNPIYRHKRANGKPAVQFDGAGDTFQVPLNSSNDMTFFVVTRGSNYQSMIRWQPGDWIVYPWGNGDLIQTQNGGTADGIDAGLMVDEWNLAGAVIDTGTTNGVRTFRNGLLQGQKTYATAWATLNPLYIGSIGGGGEYMTGEIAELIIYNRALNDNERRQVERYLMEKYGLDGEGPGGLQTTDLELWLKADDGALYDTSNLVTEWTDLSPNDHYIYQLAAAQRPDWVPNVVNGLPVVRFNPNSGATNTVEYFKSNAFWPQNTVGASVFLAAKSNSSSGSAYTSLFRYQGGTWLIYPWSDPGLFIINPDSGTSGVGVGLDPLTWNIGEGAYRANTTNGFQTFKNGSLVGQKTSANILLDANPLLVGACCGTEAINGESPNADVGEMIAYSGRQNDAKRILVQNYLSARYDRSLAANDVYAGDVLADYDWDLAGIGRIGNPLAYGNGANPFGAGTNLIGNSYGFMIEEQSFLKDNGDFMVVAHNGLPNQLTDADLAGSGAQNRWTRIWYLDKTDAGNNGGSVTLRFDLSDAALAGSASGSMLVLRRNGTSGNFSAIASSPTVVGDEFSFSVNSTSLTDGYYTLAEVDTTPPVITLSGGNPTIQCGSGYTEPGYTATDNSDGTITGNVVISGATVNPGQTGVYVVRYNVSDLAGNAALEVTRTVTVIDTVKPVISLVGLATDTAECGVPYTHPGATAFDQCNLVLTGAIVTSGLPVPVSATGPQVITYNVVDTNGNVADQVTRTVNVQDTTPPVLSLIGGTVFLECGVDTFTDPGYNAVDLCAGPVPVVVGGAVVDVNNTGNYVVTYNATDGTNSAPQQTRTVTVQDTLPPVISLVGGSVSVVAGQPYIDPGFAANDACEGNVSVTVGGAVVNTSVLGDYLVTYDAEDSGGRDAVQQTRLVSVVAGNPPVIVRNGGDVVLECQSVYTDLGATASDIEDGVIPPANIVVTNPVNTSVPGIYVVRYNVQDTSGNDASEVTRTVEVVDTGAPVLTLTGPSSLTVACGGTYVEQGATALDSCTGVLTGSVVVGGDVVDEENPGVYVVRYNVQDSSNNAAVELTRTVTVSDVVPPVLSLSGSSFVTVDCGEAYTDAGATATDACDDSVSLTNAITVSGLPIDVATPGFYTVTYNVSDSAGNAATSISRTVEVADTTPPVLALNGDALVQVLVGGTYVELGASANDLCEGDVPVIIGGDFVDTSVSNLYTVEYSASDSSGNPATPITRQVIVSVAVAPFISEEPASLTLPYGEDATFTLTAVSVAPMTYAWTKDGQPISDGPKYQGTQTASLSVLNVENADEGGYRCRVTSNSSFTDSVFASLAVNDPGILTQPVGQVVAPGSTATITVVAIGSGVITYQWYFEGSPVANGGRISGADTDTLVITDAQEEIDEGSYYVVVAGSSDPAIQSDVVSLTVGNPIIVSNPLALSLPQGQGAQFEVEAVGVAPLFYRWRKDGVNLVDGGRFSGVTTPTLNIANVQFADEGDYSCRVLGQNIVESNNAALDVFGPPVLGGVRILPESGIVVVNGPAAVTVVVLEGVQPLTYQWRRNGVNLSNNSRLSGVDAPTLNISPSIVGDTGTYDCVVSNAAGTVTSSGRQLRVGLNFQVNLVSQLVEDGQFFEWSVNAEGATGVLHYQWYKEDGTKVLVPLQDLGSLTGTTTRTLTFNPVTFADAGQYRVEVSDDLVTLLSQPGNLNVVESVPASQVAVLVLFTALLAASGLYATRRRTPRRS
jgi:hypothetical protein